jgi:drug/metabolite transporter (DMT)-like permease
MNKGIYYASFTAFLWGFLAIALKVALKELSPVTVTWVRFIVAFVSLFLFYAVTDYHKIKIIATPPKTAVVAAIFLIFNYVGYIAGIKHTSPSIGQIFIQTGPALLALSGVVVFKEKITKKQMFGFLIVLVGLSIFYHEQIINIAGGLKQYKTGVWLVLFAAFSWAMYAVFQKFAVQKANPMQLNLIIFGIPSVALIPFVDFSQLFSVSLNYWLLLIFLGLNTLAAYGSLAYAFKYLEANKISVIITLNPLITLVVMAILSKNNVSWIASEQFTLLTVVGALTVLSGVVLTVTGRKKVT